MTLMTNEGFKDVSKALHIECYYPSVYWTNVLQHDRAEGFIG